MVENQSTLSQVRHIDNSRHWLPWITTLLLIFLIYLCIWFFRGGSFRLYASLFFGLYFITRQVWVSVLLIGVLQNIIFIPLRLIGNAMDQPLKDFEDELDTMETKQQQLVFTKKIREGNSAIVYYIFNFFVNAIAFFSAGRIFLIDFYTDPLKLQKMNLLYKWVPRPEYPLKGTIFPFPFFKITDTMAISWNTIFMIIGGTVLFLIGLRLIWRLVRFIFKKNQKILYARIRYNRILATIGGFSGVLIIGLIYLLRHLPTAFAGLMLKVDLTRQNTPMNFVTAVGTFITTIHAGYKGNSLAAQEARLSGIPENVVKKVFKEKMQTSFKNALILGAGAFFITNQIPSAFELSVAMFEVMYMIYPYTFGKIVSLGSRVKKIEETNVATN
ncbi:MAG: hypothetical protein KIH89_002385 [Candidatus Shapirobacteria bacterium]|nr:hypothetical protein [Candidatus Shapirobacteria bacterium]